MFCCWTLSPDHVSVAHEVEGAGVGEVGGSHWYAEPNNTDDKISLLDGSCLHSNEARVHVEVRYTIQANGLVDSQWNIDASKALPARHPKLPE